VKFENLRMISYCLVKFQILNLMNSMMRVKRNRKIMRFVWLSRSLLVNLVESLCCHCSGFSAHEELLLYQQAR